MEKALPVSWKTMKFPSKSHWNRLKIPEQNFCCNKFYSDSKSRFWDGGGSSCSNKWEKRLCNNRRRLRKGFDASHRRNRWYVSYWWLRHFRKSLKFLLILGTIQKTWLSTVPRGRQKEIQKLPVTTNLTIRIFSAKIVSQHHNSYLSAMSAKTIRWRINTLVASTSSERSKETTGK